MLSNSAQNTPAAWGGGSSIITVFDRCQYTVSDTADVPELHLSFKSTLLENVRHHIIKGTKDSRLPLFVEFQYEKQGVSDEDKRLSISEGGLCAFGIGNRVGFIFQGVVLGNIRPSTCAEHGSCVYLWNYELVTLLQQACS